MPRHIRSLEVRNPTILPEELTEKFIILDILAVDENNRQYDIEMQVQKFSYYPERTLYYLCRMYAGQLEAGEPFTHLTPVIGIHFVDYEQFSEQAIWRWCFELRDVQHPVVRLTTDLSLYLLELPKLDRLPADNRPRRRFGNGCIFSTMPMRRRMRRCADSITTPGFTGRFTC